MFCQKTFKIFDLFFPVTYSIAFFPCKWNKASRNFSHFGVKYSFLHYLWFFNNFLVAQKSLYLLWGLRSLLKLGNLWQIVFQVMLLTGYLACLDHNFYLWKYRESFQSLFQRCISTTKTNERRFKFQKYKYPLGEEDPVHSSGEAAIIVIFMWTISIFILNMANPLFSPLLSSSLQASSSYIFVRLLFSILEAYLMCFTWNTNISMIVIMQFTTYFSTFWVAQLNTEMDSVKNVKRAAVAYRELQLLTAQHNECFSSPTSDLLFLAFANQTATNFGAFKLYGVISPGAWATCIYMMLTGTRNLFHLHTVLAAANLTSEETKKCWRDILSKGNLSVRDKKWFTKFERACQPMKIFQGNYRYFKLDSGIEFVDSVIDKTVSLLLY